MERLQNGFLGAPADDDVNPKKRGNYRIPAREQPRVERLQNGFGGTPADDDVNRESPKGKLSQLS